jgi:hypothetical protein
MWVARECLSMCGTTYDGRPARLLIRSQDLAGRSIAIPRKWTTCVAAPASIRFHRLRCASMRLPKRTGGLLFFVLTDPRSFLCMMPVSRFTIDHLRPVITLRLDPVYHPIRKKRARWGVRRATRRKRAASERVIKSCLGCGLGGSLIFGVGIMGAWFAFQWEIAAFRKASSRREDAPAFLCAT